MLCLEWDSAGARVPHETKFGFENYVKFRVFHFLVGIYFIVEEEIVI